MRRWRSKWSKSSWLLLAGLGGCGARGPAHAPPGETAAACEERRQAFVELVRGLPDSAAEVSLRTEIADSALGAVPGPGPVLEVSSSGAALDGQALRGDDADARAADLATRLSAEAGGQRALYVAAARDVDVHTVKRYLAAVPKALELRLLVRVRSAAASKSSERTQRGLDVAARMLAEPDPVQRAEISRQGFAEFSSCSALDSAIASVGSGAAQAQPRVRWPRLKNALVAALPSCACGALDTRNLGHLVLAEQRAATMSLGWLPLEFLRDVRCDASMPRRAMQKLVTQIGQFDEEFAGAWQSDALRFDDVVTNERLLNQFCDALAGETLTALARARATLYLRPTEGAACEPWRLEALSPGAPMGTLRRTRDGLAFHYWEAAESLRVFGPAEDSSQPTDRRTWPCDQNYKLTGVDSDSIGLEAGAWFVTEAACQAKSQPAWASCLAERAGGAAVAPPSSQSQGGQPSKSQDGQAPKSQSGQAPKSSGIP